MLYKLSHDELPLRLGAKIEPPKPAPVATLPAVTAWIEDCRTLASDRPPTLKLKPGPNFAAAVRRATHEFIDITVERNGMRACSDGTLLTWRLAPGALFATVHRKAPDGWTVGKALQDGHDMTIGNVTLDFNTIPF